MSFQTSPEAIDKHAWRSEAGQFYHRGRPELDSGPERHSLEVQPCGGDVFAEVSRLDFVTATPQALEKLARHQVDLTQIGETRLPSCEISVSNEGASVRVTVHAVAFNQQDLAPRHLAEAVAPIR